MDISTLRDSTSAELDAQVENYRKELFLLRMKKSTGQLKTTHELKQVKRNIARVLTIKSELSLVESQKEGDN